MLHNDEQCLVCLQLCSQPNTPQIQYLYLRYYSSIHNISVTLSHSLPSHHPEKAVESFQRVVEAAQQNDESIVLEALAQLCVATSLSPACRQRWDRASSFTVVSNRPGNVIRSGRARSAWSCCVATSRIRSASTKVPTSSRSVSQVRFQPVSQREHIDGRCPIAPDALDHVSSLSPHDAAPLVPAPALRGLLRQRQLPGLLAGHHSRRLSSSGASALSSSPTSRRRVAARYSRCGRTRSGSCATL